MNNTVNITSTNSHFTKKREIDIGGKYQLYSSKSKKDKKFVRLLSAGNINPKYKNNNMMTNYYNLPSLNNNNSIKIKKIRLNNSTDNKKTQLKIDLERIYEQNILYKKTIKNLQLQIKLVKKDTENKEKLLNMKKDEINSIINENQYLDSDFIPAHENSKISLVKKMRNQIKQSEHELNEHISKNLELKKNKKHTKKKELLIEEKIYDAHCEQIMKLIENSNQYKNDKSKEIIQNEIFNNNLENQQKILISFEEKFQELEKEEEFLKNEIIKYEKLLFRLTNKVKIVRLNNISLKEQNYKLKKEKNNFLDKNGKEDYSLEKYKKDLIKAKKDYIYNKLKSKKTMEKLYNLKKKYNTSFEQYKKASNTMNFLSNNIKKIPIQNNQINDLQKKQFNNTEEYIIELKKIYQENREKENELEQGLFLYQKAVKSMKDGENINLAEIKENIINAINDNKKNNNSDNNNNNLDNNSNNI